MAAGAAICLLVCLLLPTVVGAELPDLPLTLPGYTATNLPDPAQQFRGAALAFDTAQASPAEAEYFFVRYQFTIPPEGGNAFYSLVLQGGKGPGSRGQSNYSWVVDGGEVHSALRLQRVLAEPAKHWEHVQPPVRLSAGLHTLELRFYPTQRMHGLNRFDQPFVGHHVDLAGLAWRPVAAPAPVSHEALSPNCRLRRHDRIVLLGDSITEEEFYARHLVRILDRVYPGHGMTVYNAGISLNRSTDGEARLEQDVIALDPDWCVLAFGVNDGMLVAPEEFATASDRMIARLQKRGIGVICASPTGMMPYAEGLGAGFFSMHATDRALALDHTMAVNAALLQKVAQHRKVIFADVYGAFTRTPFPRYTLMANQWHPNDEGGRLFAATLLWAWGMTEAEVARSGDTRDLADCRAVAALPPAPEVSFLAPKTPTEPLGGTLVLGAAYGDNRLIIYAPDGRQLAIIPTAHHPAAVAYASRRRELYVACEGADRLMVFSLPALRQVTEIRLTEAYPTSLALSAEESTLWVGCYFGSRLLELDLATRKIRREMPFPDVVNGVAFAPDGRTLLVSLPGKLMLVDSAAGKATATIETVKFTTPCVTLPDGQPYLLDAEHWQMYPVEVAGEKLGPPAPAPGQTRALAVDSATGHLFACDWRNSRLLELDGERCVRATPLPAPALALAVIHLE